MTFQGGPHEHDPRLGRGNLRERRFLRDLRRAGDSGAKNTCFHAFFTFCVFLARCGRTTCSPAPCTSQTRRTCAAQTPRAGVINAYISIVYLGNCMCNLIIYISGPSSAACSTTPPSPYGRATTRTRRRSRTTGTCSFSRKIVCSILDSIQTTISNCTWTPSRPALRRRIPPGPF